MNTVTFRLALVEDATVVADMATALTSEIMTRTGMRHFDVSRDDARALCRRLIEEGAYSVLIAEVAGMPAGFAALCESHALYAGGTFGIVQEFCVMPRHRSAGVGHALIEAVVLHGRERGWRRLELCTPPLPEFDRALAFYQDNGFEVTGGRKMKREL
jgi:GNAT superfamily N-acetyltransferase